MMKSLNDRQKTEMTRFLFSVMNFDKGCIVKTGNDSEIGLCLLGVPGSKDIEQCMAVAFTADGESAFGVNFDCEFVFYNRQNMIKGLPVIFPSPR